jgi:hypothetical protein
VRLEEFLRPRLAEEAGIRPEGPRLVIMPMPSPDERHPEADQDRDMVRLYPKFFRLFPETRRHVLLHELGHWYRQEFIELRDIMGWEEGDKFYNCFWAGNSEEGFAECFAVYWDEPQLLLDRHPWCFQFIYERLAERPFNADAWADWAIREIQGIGDPQP